MTNKVENFIERFTEHEKTEDLFQFGCCYWFAFILFRRFLKNGAKIMYDETENHFGTQVGNRVYDITGDVTDKYHWCQWEYMEDDLLKQRVIRDCIMF